MLKNAAVNYTPNRFVINQLVIKKKKKRFLQKLNIYHALIKIFHTIIFFYINTNTIYLMLYKHTPFCIQVSFIYQADGRCYMTGNLIH